MATFVKGVVLGLVGLGVVACTNQPTPTAGATDTKSDVLVGAWRSKVQFLDGPFAEAKDLEFLFVFNAGGTMTESSNYDGAPPVPPAYGVWKRVSDNKFELKYEYFNSQPPKAFTDIQNGGGWTPGGRGTILETVTVSADGKTFQSELTFELRDQSGKVIPGGGKAKCTGERMSF